MPADGQIERERERERWERLDDILEQATSTEEEEGGDDRERCRASAASLRCQEQCRRATLGEENSDWRRGKVN